MRQRTGSPTRGTVPIRFGTYNIRNGRNRGSESSLGGMSQANMDLGIFQETKVTDGIYTRGSDGYSVVATDAPIRHRGGLAEPEGDRRGEDIAAALATEGLEYMLAHFLPRRRPWCWAGGRGVYYERGGRCGPGRTISWRRIAVSLEMSPSRTLGTTQTITWF